MHWRRNGQSREQNKQKKKHWKILISWPEANKNKAKSFQSAVIYYPLTEKKNIVKSWCSDAKQQPGGIFSCDTSFSGTCGIT